MNEPINQRTDNRSTNQIGGQLGFERSATGLNGPAYCMNMIKTTKPPGCGNKRTSTGASQAGDNIFYFLKAHEKKKKLTPPPSPPQNACVCARCAFAMLCRACAVVACAAVVMCSAVAVLVCCTLLCCALLLFFCVVRCLLFCAVSVLCFAVQYM